MPGLSRFPVSIGIIPPAFFFLESFSGSITDSSDGIHVLIQRRYSVPSFKIDVRLPYELEEEEEEDRINRSFNQSINNNNR